MYPLEQLGPDTVNLIFEYHNPYHDTKSKVVSYVKIYHKANVRTISMLREAIAVAPDAVRHHCEFYGIDLAWPDHKIMNHLSVISLDMGDDCMYGPCLCHPYSIFYTIDDSREITGGTIPWINDDAAMYTMFRHIFKKCAAAGHLWDWDDIECVSEADKMIVRHGMRMGVVSDVGYASHYHIRRHNIEYEKPISYNMLCNMVPNFGSYRASDLEMRRLINSFTNYNVDMFLMCRNISTFIPDAITTGDKYEKCVRYFKRRISVGYKSHYSGVLRLDVIKIMMANPQDPTLCRLFGI
jgi:hypothetical protein